jgi:hypothetical protein
MKVILTLLLATIAFIYSQERKQNEVLMQMLNQRKGQIKRAFKAGYFTREQTAKIPIVYTWPHDSNKFEKFVNNHLK